MKTSLHPTVTRSAPAAMRGGNTVERLVSNRTSAPRESSIQPDYDPTRADNFGKADRFEATPIARLARSAETEREYRRAARAAEMTAWNAAMPGVDARQATESTPAANSFIERVVTNALFLLVVAFAGAAWVTACPETLQSFWLNIESAFSQWFVS